MTTKFRHVDTKRPDGCYVTFERKVLHDDIATPLDYLFQDEEYREEDQARLDAWKRDEWSFIGIQAVAHILVVIGGMGTIHTIISAGLWGTESDSDDDYIDSIYCDEKADLMDQLRAFASPIVSGED